MPSKLFRLHLTNDNLNIFDIPVMFTALSIIDNNNLIVASQSGVNNFNLTNKN